MALTVTIGGYPATDYSRVGSLSISDSLNSRNTCDLTLIERDGVFDLATSDGDTLITSDGDTLVTGFRPEMGQAIVIQRDGVTIFAGTIAEVEETKLEGSRALEFQLSCDDQNQLADKRKVAAAYQGETLGAIVTDIVTSLLAAEGVSATYVETGPVIEKAVFSYLSVSEAFDEIATTTGYIWWIDYDKHLHFCSRESNAAPFGLTDTSDNFRKMKVRRTRDQYRNRQYVRAGQDLTDERTDPMKGDGESKTFVMPFPVGTEPVITVNGVAGTVGIRGVETGKDWYWNKNSNEISQDDAATPILATDSATATYRGLFPLMMIAQDDAEIAERAAVEGGTGLYEDIVDRPNIDSLSLATDEGNALIRKFKIPTIVEFETDDDGLASGQLLPLNVAAHGLAGSFLIDKVKLKDRDGRSLVYTVRALSGESLGGWERSFRSLAQSGRSYTIRENEVVTNLRRLVETVTIADSVTFTVGAPENVTNIAVTNYSETAPA